MNRFRYGLLASLLFIVQPLITDVMAEDGHGHDQAASGQHDDGEHDEGGVHLTPQQQTAAGIVTEVLTPKDVAGEIRAPGEIRLNAYATSMVTPRIAAQVMKRHARLGDHVKHRTALLTLSSVEMAKAQGEVLVTEREWRRVKKLGREVVSEQRYTNARVTREQARARVQAFGMTKRQLGELISSGDASRADGTFQLLASQSGTVIRDDFIVGELVEPGRVLFEISDESVLWVEAKLTAVQAVQVATGAGAIVIADGRSLSGKVIQVHHALEEDTRTLGVRIEILNPDDKLHPGLFVDVRIASTGLAPALAVPEAAILRNPDGDWVVFIEHEAGEYKPVEVNVTRTVLGMAVISGIAPGTSVVTKGAFFLQSELAKAGFEVHNH